MFQPKKVLNPRLKIIFIVTLAIVAAVSFLLIAMTMKKVEWFTGAITGGLSALISLGIISVYAGMRDMPVYIPNPKLEENTEKKETAVAASSPKTKKASGKASAKEQAESPSKNHGCLIAVIATIVIIILLSILSGIFIYLGLKDTLKGKRTEIPGIISNIKDETAEIDVAKQVGDVIAAKQPTVYNLSNVSQTAVFGQSNLSRNFPPSVYNYAISAFGWGQKVQNGVNGNWSDVPEEPASAQLTLSGQDASDTYDDSLENIARFQEQGDYYLAKNDRTHMLWIGARLHAEEIYLNALANANVSQGPSNVAYATTYGSQCYYGRGRVLFFSDRSAKGKENCIKKLADKVTPLRKAAQNYTLYGRPKAAGDWRVAVTDLGGIGYPISKTGATVEPSGSTPPPLILAFQDACKAKGGNTPSGGVKNRMPTNEGGQTCAFKGPKGGACWDFQTDSGRNFSGGDGDCPESGLLPATGGFVDPNKNNQNNGNKNTNNPYPYDGTYKTTPNIPCSKPTDSTSLNGDIQNLLSSFTVKQGKVYFSEWYTKNVKKPPANPTIDTNGNIADRYLDDENGSAVESTDYNAHFTLSGNAVTVNGNLSGYWYFGTNGAYKATCKGTFSGSRVGN